MAAALCTSMHAAAADPAVMPVSSAAAKSASDIEFTAAQSNYLLGCGGCHGVQGVSNSRLVPTLHDQVGYYLNVPKGREYLVRVPNVAFFTVTDRELAEMLNFVVFQIGGASTPADAKPYTAAEVAKLRRQPLTEVSLIEYRNQIIDTLIANYHAPAALRSYGNDDYHVY